MRDMGMEPVRVRGASEDWVCATASAPLRSAAINKMRRLNFIAVISPFRNVPPRRREGFFRRAGAQILLFRPLKRTRFVPLPATQHFRAGLYYAAATRLMRFLLHLRGKPRVS